MLSGWIIEVARRVDGRAIASRFGETQGRKVRELIASGCDLSPARADRLMKHLLDHELERSKLDQADREKLAETMGGLGPISGPLGAFVLGQQLHETSYGLWLGQAGISALAERYDALSDRLRPLVAVEDFEAVRCEILDADQLTGNEWLSPTDDSDMRPVVENAEGWSDIKPILVGIHVNAILSFMALWDVAYSSAIFPIFSPIPTFLLIAPKISTPKKKVRPSAVGRSVGSRKIREVFDLPFSTFFDLIAALTFYCRESAFPADQMTLKEMSILFGIETKKLDRYRSGRDKLTEYVLTILLSNEIEPANLWPLLCAAHLWATLLCPPKSGGEQKIIMPDDTYLRFWNEHRANLQSRGVELPTGNIPWPGYLTRQE